MLSRTRSRRAAVQKQAQNGAAGLGAGIDALRDRGQSAVETLTPKIESARDALAPHLETARDVAGQALSEAGEWAAPRLGAAREQAVTTARDKVAPVVTKAVTTAVVASAPVRKEAKNRADAAVAALRGEVGPPKRKRRWHRVSFLLGAGAVTGVAAALVIRRKEPTFPPYEPTTGGVDPYAQPTTTQPPAAPITSLNDEIAGNVNPTPSTDTLTSEAAAPTNDSDAAPATGDTTIDVTDQPVVAGTDTGTNTGRHRKRTRRGEPE